MNSEKKPSVAIAIAIIGALALIAVPVVSRLVDIYLPTPVPATLIQPSQIVTTVATLPEPTSQPNVQVISTSTAIAVNPTSSQIAPVVINDITNNKSHSFDFPPAVNNPSSCAGAYLETGMTTVDYKLDVPNSWVVIIDSWKAEWSSGNYQNNGIVIIIGEWQGNIKVNIGAICAVPANLLQSTLEIRRNLTKNDGRPEFTIP